MAASWRACTRARHPQETQHDERHDERRADPGADRRPHRRQRLRRRDHGLPPGSRRRQGRRPGTRPVGAKRRVRARLQAWHVLHADLRFRRGRRDERARGELRRRRQRGVLRHDAARAPLRVRAPGQHRPADVAVGHHSRHARPVVRPGGRGPADQQAGLERGHLSGRAVGRAVQSRRADGQPAERRDRHRPVHQLQLDDGRLPVRRQAFAAAELPAGRSSRTARRSGRCTRSSG